MTCIIIHDATHPKTENNNWYIFPIQQYPYQREPGLGDILLLKKVQTISKDDHTHEYVAHLDGIYAVTLVCPGKLSELYPGSHPVNTSVLFDPQAWSFRLCVTKAANLIPDVTPIVPEIICAP